MVYDRWVPAEWNQTVIPRKSPRLHFMCILHLKERKKILLSCILISQFGHWPFFIPQLCHIWSRNELPQWVTLAVLPQLKLECRNWGLDQKLSGHWEWDRNYPLQMQFLTLRIQASCLTGSVSSLEHRYSSPESRSAYGCYLWWTEKHNYKERIFFYADWLSQMSLRSHGKTYIVGKICFPCTANKRFTIKLDKAIENRVFYAEILLYYYTYVSISRNVTIARSKEDLNSPFPCLKPMAGN